MKPARILIFALIGLLASCTTTVIVDGTNPTPRVNQTPVRIGVYYDENFKSFQHTEALQAEGTWKINFGDQNHSFFETVISAMYAEVVPLESADPSAAQAQQLDAIFIPKIEKFGFLTPGLSGLNYFSASIHYRVTLLDSEGRELADWAEVGYGKSEGGAFGRDDALGAATMEAIRDGWGQFAKDFPQIPEVVAWAESRQESVNES